MQAKLHENQSKPQPNRVELSAILGVASCRGTCQGCQHLTDLIISILFLSLSLSLCLNVSLAISLCRTMLQGERVACCIPHASCPIVMRKYGICVTIKCASHLCYPHPQVCVGPSQARPGQVPGSAAALPAPPTCGATWCCWCSHNLTCSILHAPKLCWQLSVASHCNGCYSLIMPATCSRTRIISLDSTLPLPLLLPLPLAHATCNSSRRRRSRCSNACTIY